MANEKLRRQIAYEAARMVLLRLEADPAVAPGGCLVQTPTHCVDATLDGQLA